jgi:phosphoribosylamine-glycine ligase
VSFYLDEKNIEKALVHKEFIPEEKQKLTEYQEKLKTYLRNLEIIIFEDGAERGYAKMICGQLQELIKLREENLEEHNKFIDGNKNYSKLYKMFRVFRECSSNCVINIST